MPSAILKRWNGTAWEEAYPKTTHTQIVASGTPSSTTFLRGDGTWATPAGVDNYVNITGDTMTGAISMTSAVAHPGNSTPTALSYGKLTGYGSFFVNADTDGSTSEYLYLTAGYGNGAGASNEGMRIGYAENSLTWKGHRIFTDNYHPNADTLTTARTINVSTGAAGTATSFNGSSNISIPITGVSESYLTWGGKGLSGQVTPIGMSMSNEHSANRLAFINGDSLYFEYSADAGATWTDYGYSASTKSQFCTTSVGVPIGRTSGEYTTDSRTRITLTAQNGTTAYVYTNPRKMLIEIASSGSMQVLVETRTGANYQSDGPWSTFGTYTLSGWTGWNDIPLVLGTLGGGTTQTGNNWQLRLTFIMTSKNTTYPTTAQVNKLRIYGENTWSMPSTLAATNDMYTYDMSQNVFFPAAIQGTRLTSTVATGTSPLTVTSTTVVTNLNADLLDGIHSSGFVPNNGSWTGGTGSPYTTLAYSVKSTGNTKFTFYNDAGNMDVITDGEFYANEGAHKVWHAGNDGAGSGLDADLLDGNHASAFYLATNPSGYQTAAQVSASIAALVDSAPGTLDTLNELAAALGDDPNFATTVTNAIAGKVSKSGDTMTGDLTISKVNTLLILSETDCSDSTYPGIQFDTAVGQGVKLYHNEFDSQLPTGGYGLVLGPSPNNTQWGTSGTLVLAVLGEIYAGSTTLGSTQRVFHDGYHPNADTLTTARTLTIGSTGKTFNGSANVSWSLGEIGAAATSHTHAISDVTNLQTSLDSKVNTSAVGAANGVVPLNASSKINETYLPNFIFGGMRYISSISTNITAETLLDSAQSYVASNGGTVSGCYFIVSGTATVTITGGTDTNNGVIHTFSPGPISMTGEEGDNSFDTIDLEPGDWLIINDTWGPYFSSTYQRWSVVNNTYALVTTSAPGIMSAADKTK